MVLSEWVVNDEQWAAIYICGCWALWKGETIVIHEF
jgi:hypothetical protein